MDLKIKKAEDLSGKVKPTSSKFFTQFSTATSLLAEGKSVIKSPLVADDTRCLVKAIETMGATTKRSKKRWSIWGEGSPPYPSGQVVDAKKSITSLSLLTSLSALASRVMVVTGKSQIRSKPVTPLIKGLQKMGVDVHSTKTNDTPPVIIFESDIKGGKISLKEENDPRFLPAFLILTPLAEEEIEIELTPELESQKVEMAIEIMKECGIDISKEDDNLKILQGEYNPIEVSTPKDIFSTIPYVLGSVLTGSDITISDSSKCVGKNEFVDILEDIGLETEEKSKSLKIKPPEEMQGREINLEKFPEMLPFVATFASMTEGETKIVNSKRARFMKSDRISAITEGLQRMKVDIEETQDGIIVNGPAELKGTVVNGYEDDAIVASLAIAGLLAEGETIVKNRAETLRESYPEFVSTFKNLGAEMSYKS